MCALSIPVGCGMLPAPLLGATFPWGLPTGGWCWQSRLCRRADAGVQLGTGQGGGSRRSAEIEAHWQEEAFEPHPASSRGGSALGPGTLYSRLGGSSWPGADLHQPTHIGLPFSQKALKMQLFLPSCQPAAPALQGTCSRVEGRQDLTATVPAVPPKCWVKPGFAGCQVEWMWCLDKAQQKLIMSISNKDPTSAAPQHPALALGNVPSLPPSSASLGSPTAMGQPALLLNSPAASMPLVSPSPAGDRHGPGSVSSSPGAQLCCGLCSPFLFAKHPRQSACLSLLCGHLWSLPLSLGTHSQLHSCPSCAVMMLSSCQDLAHACIGRNSRFFFFSHTP